MSDDHIFARATGWCRAIPTTAKLKPVQMALGWSIRYPDKGHAQGFVTVGLYNRETGTTQTIELTAEMTGHLIDRLATTLNDVEDKVADADEQHCDCPAHGGQA